jgi:hypothetical protein
MDEQRFNDLTIGIFDNKDSAEHAFNAAMELGYQPEEITVLMSEDTRKKYYNSYLNPKPEESPKGLAVGGAVGGAIGGTLGALIALGTNLALPGIGLAIAGPLAGAGGISGILLGGLIGWGDKPSKTYEEELKAGKIILGVHEIKGKPSIEDIWRSSGSIN